MKKIKLAITGASGFLGTELLKKLDPSKFEVFILGRHYPDSLKNMNNNGMEFRWLAADISNPEVVVNESDRDLLLSCEYVYHGAAFYDLKGSYNDCFLANVAGTSNLLNFFRQSKNLKEFHYVSTVAVIDPVGDELIFEDVLPQRQKFDDYYSQTKYAAEKLVREFKFETDICKIIYRPGVIVASSTDSKNFKMDGPYYFARALKQVRTVLNFLPFVMLNFNPKANLPMVPVDHVAQFIAQSLQLNSLAPTSSRRKDATYQLVSDDLPAIPDFLEEIFSELGINTQLKNSTMGFINKFLLTNLGIPKETIPFMFHCHSYDKSNTYRDFENGFKSQYKDFKHSLLKSLKDV